MCKVAFQELAEELTMVAMTEARRKGYTNEMIAMKVGKSVSSAEKWSSAVRTPSLKQFLALIVGLKLKEPVRMLAELVGLVAVEPPECSDIAHYGKILKETGEAVAALSKAIEDGRIDPEEAREVIKEAREMLSVWFAKLHELEKISGGQQ